MSGNDTRRRGASFFRGGGRLADVSEIDDVLFELVLLTALGKDISAIEYMKKKIGVFFWRRT